MKHNAVLLLAFILLAAGIWIGLSIYNDKNGSEIETKSFEADSRMKPELDSRHQPRLVENIDSVISKNAEEDHLLAQEQIMSWLREQQILTQEDQALLVAYLQQDQPVLMSAGAWEERVNEILNLLRSQPDGVVGLADLMMDMAKNDANSVLRMYAMQHIFLWIPSEPSEEKRDEMIAYLKNVAETPSDMHSGAAVMFLSDLERSEASNGVIIDGVMISRAALRLVENTEIDTAARISALHTCTDRRVMDALPTARRLAADESQMIPLRKAAIHCIGQVGELEDVDLLERLAVSNTVLQTATKPAIKSIVE